MEDKLRHDAAESRGKMSETGQNGSVRGRKGKKCGSRGGRSDFIFEVRGKRKHKIRNQ